MNQTRALKIVLALVGILFLATIYPMVIMMRQEPALSMMLSLYATLGVFLRQAEAAGVRRAPRGKADGRLGHAL